MRHVLIVLAALLPAACAHHHDVRGKHAQRAQLTEEVVEVQRAVPSALPEPEAAPLRRPEAAYARMERYGKPRVMSGERVTIPVPDDGLPFLDLFEFVSRETGVRIRYEQNNVVVKSKRVAFVGPVSVAREDLLAWMQDVCFYSGLVAFEYGPSDRRELAVLDYANANLTSNVQHVHEDHLPHFSGRTGVYISSVLTLPEGVDAPRARQALSQMSTKTAGLGRINDIGDSGVLVVSDFAAIVVSMRQALDEMAIRRYEAQTQ